MVEPSVIQEMLDELRFDEAEELVKRSGPGDDDGFLSEISKRREDAENRARDVARLIIELGEKQKLAEVSELANEPSTAPLLAIAPDTSRERAQLYLREAQRWAEARERVNARRLGEARRALDGLDLELARGLMRRIDGRFLNSGLEEERDRLLLDISARAMDVESLEETGRRLTEGARPRRRNQRKARWWRRGTD
jgi:hypothetical protein